MTKRGAEATITRGQWHGRDVIFKERSPKSYRDGSLDMTLRTSRTKREASLLSEAKQFGIATPIVYDIDVSNFIMVMEYIDGDLAKTLLQNRDDRLELAEKIGRSVGAMHKNDIIHGDLTTSNMIFRDEVAYFIDFGLGEKSHEPERKGVDLHLLKEAMDSAHSEFPKLFDSVTKGYLDAYEDGHRILAIVKNIEKRGRYS